MIRLGSEKKLALKRSKITPMIVRMREMMWMILTEMVLGEVFSLLTADIPSTLSEDSNY